MGQDWRPDLAISNELAHAIVNRALRKAAEAESREEKASWMLKAG